MIRRAPAATTVALVGMVGICVVVPLMQVLLRPGWFLDLRVYRAGGTAWLTGVPLYGPEFPALVGALPLPFTYPPIAAVLFAGLAVIPLLAAAVLLTTAGSAALGATAWLTAHRAEPDRARAALLVAAAVVLGAFTEPVRETLAFGQVNLVLMALVAADCLLPRTPWPRGALIGVTAAVKLTPAVFVLFFLAHRQWRPVLTALAAFAVVTAAGFATAPAASAEYWFGGVLTNPARIGSPAFPSNQSLSGLLHRLGLAGSAHTAAWLLAALIVACAAAVAVRRLRGSGQEVPALLVVAAAGLLASPVSWSHHYVWAVPALVWGAHRAWRVPRWRPACALAAAVFLIGPHWQVATRADHVPQWNPGEQVVGNSYVWLALLVVAVGAVARPWAPAGGTRRGQRRVRIRVAPAAAVDSSSQPTAVSPPATHADASDVRHSPS